MEESNASGPTWLLRRKQFEANEKGAKVAVLGTMIRDFDSMIAQLEEQIAAEEDRTRIKDSRHPMYSMVAKAAAKRRQNLLVSVAHTRSMLEVAKRELDAVTAQLLDLAPIQNNPQILTAQAISVAR